jgi:hypothetical protein
VRELSFIFLPPFERAFDYIFAFTCEKCKSKDQEWLSSRNGGACKANKDQEWWSSRDGGHRHARANNCCCSSRFQWIIRIEDFLLVLLLLLWFSIKRRGGLGD